MKLLLAALIIAILILIRKNNTAALVLAILTVIIYIKSVPYISMLLATASIGSITSYYIPFLQLIYIALMITSVVLIYRNKRKAARWMLWITLALLALHNWNIWLNLIIWLF